MQLIIDDDTALVLGKNGFFGFIPLQSKAFLSNCTLTSRDLVTFALLRFSHVVVVYPAVSDEISIAQLQEARNAFHTGELQLKTICDTIITAENCKLSLSEWCIAHSLLIEAVRRGIVPKSRNYNGKYIHWHLVLYQHCGKLAMGRNDIAFILLSFQQAEEAGVIARGGAEAFVNEIGLRTDIDKEHRHAYNAFYQLFMRQAKMDVTKAGCLAKETRSQ